MTTPSSHPPDALPALSVPEVRGSTFPEPFKSRLGDRVKRRLGEAFGLTQFGVNLVVIPAGGQSALRHWHTLEEEFVYVLEGELVLITDAGETNLRTGDCAGFPAGTGNAHHMANRSTASASYLEVGARCPGDIAFYPDDDVMWAFRAGEGEARGQAVEMAAHKDGRPY